MQIRLRKDGKVLNVQQFRAMHQNTSLPVDLTEEILNDLDADVLLEGKQATDGEFWQYSVRKGEEQIAGKWYTKYVLGPIFQDYTDDKGILHTAEDQKNAYIALKTQEKEKALEESVVKFVQERLDNFAKTRNYDNILSACTYATSTVPKFKTEGQYCVDVRDATWSKLYEILEEVKSGKRSTPKSYSDIETELPVLKWVM